MKVKTRAIAGLIHTVSKLPGLVNNAVLTEKKKGRKHHSVMDTQGNLVHGTVHDANHSKGVQCFLSGSATISDTQKRLR
ncbi:hypothetical protein [Holospora curviuscula]|uniref:Uncharacterized protein n=1 Tax=Holospora curviuscula TaxID=1082868 RepID=A0A2S5R924_9PROT|nr:hypothetical protein [Holospora curviuscula]PPE03800.1 hypothetical protein HCUR_00815 [Holospora curviuscula]